MKKLTIILSILLVMTLCIGCGPYRSYAGTYTRTISGTTYTIRLSSSGTFKWERKASNQYDPLEKQANVREGTYSVEKDRLMIEYTKYEQATGEYLKATAVATVNDGTLTIDWGNGNIQKFTKK